ncbi:amino acid ABC transporter ATP-binding protein [Sinomonas terrae]|uniref:Amino acid ABC transporter ATP-binding protein n=1 Tax=Sinomonas terrae TaxID=2908838 RepID=A0ABS9U6X3_9MICC|nr:amino acid ABC transporter ATP-binding protein [Sinomonas terrae]MCH6472448.1 amino acid ABC transporter ATP-binding protein [Sinomonas terrae]
MTVTKEEQEVECQAQIAGQNHLLSARGLCKTFRDEAVLDDVDFDIDAGEVVVIIGRSGSGKSTLLRAVAGLTEPEAGDVCLNGRLVRRNGERTPEWEQGASQVGMIFQSYTLWPHMDVMSNLTLAPRKVLNMGRAEARERAITALGEVGMGSYCDAQVSQLSGGQRQRVAIARALMMRPKLLLCDEITSALDPPVAAEVLGVLTRLKDEEGLAIALVTHDMAFAAKAADRVMFFSHGKVKVNATPKEAFEQCEVEELRQFVDAVRFG